MKSLWEKFHLASFMIVARVKLRQRRHLFYLIWFNFLWSCVELEKLLSICTIKLTLQYSLLIDFVDSHSLLQYACNYFWKVSKIISFPCGRQMNVCKATCYTLISKNILPYTFFVCLNLLIWTLDVRTIIESSGCVNAKK